MLSRLKSFRFSHNRDRSKTPDGRQQRAKLDMEGSISSSLLTSSVKETAYNFDQLSLSKNCLSYNLIGEDIADV